MLRCPRGTEQALGETEQVAAKQKPEDSSVMETAGDTLDLVSDAIDVVTSIFE